MAKAWAIGLGVMVVGITAGAAVAGAAGRYSPVGISAMCAFVTAAAVGASLRSLDQDHDWDVGHSFLAAMPSPVVVLTTSVGLAWVAGGLPLKTILLAMLMMAIAAGAAYLYWWARFRQVAE